MDEEEKLKLNNDEINQLLEMLDNKWTKEEELDEELWI